jgi:hypothetical protein
MKLVDHVCKAQNIGLVPHFMDDWLTSVISNRSAIGIGRIGSRKNMTKVLRHCHEGIGISEAMAAEYATTCKIPMCSIANGVEDDLMEDLRLTSGDVDHATSSFRLSLLGRLDYSRSEIVVRLVDALEQLDVPGRRVSLSIYTDSKIPSGLLGRRKITVNRAKPPTDAELGSLQGSTDCLVYVDGFGSAEESYFRLSVSAKIPLYLALGRPILTIGPSTVNSIAYLRSCGVGPVVTADSVDALEKAAKHMFSLQVSDRLRMGERAMEIAQNKHGAQSQRTRLRDVLSRSSNRNP